jgi:hypothetical protein
VSSVTRERCAAIEDVLPDGYHVSSSGRFAYAVRIDMSDGPIRRKYIGEMTPNRGGWWAVSAVVDGGQMHPTTVEAALWLVEQWEANDHEQ